jgi:hypothetical protein
MKFARTLEQLSRSFLFAGTIGFGGGAGLIAWISQLADAPILHDLAFVLLYLMPIPCVLAILLGWAAKRFRKAAIRSMKAFIAVLHEQPPADGRVDNLRSYGAIKLDLPGKPAGRTVCAILECCAAMCYALT